MCRRNIRPPSSGSKNVCFSWFLACREGASDGFMLGAICETTDYFQNKRRFSLENHNFLIYRRENLKFNVILFTVFDNKFR
jgi:hypothetical protein